MLAIDRRNGNYRSIQNVVNKRVFVRLTKSKGALHTLPKPPPSVDGGGNSIDGLSLLAAVYYNEQH